MPLLTQHPAFEDRLKLYKTLLIKWSQSLNLVSKSTLENVEMRHFQDSLQLLPFLREGSRILDVGTGAGFPGMVLAMYGFEVVLLDSDQKKCVFLESVSRETKTPVEIVCARVEAYKNKKIFDVVCSRGVASLPKLLNLTHHLIKKNHTVGLFLKGENVDLELEGVEEGRLEKHNHTFQSNSYIITYKY